MDTTLLDNLVHLTTSDLSNDWYSEAFICESLVNYLKENGYKIHKDVYTKMPDKVDSIIIASRFFTREIIEVKGFPSDFSKHPANKEVPKNTSHLQHAKNWFSEALLNSFINFGKYYSNDTADVAMALPNVEKYKAIIGKVQDYFTLNNLYFKIYLVNQDGSVEVSNLNIKMLKESTKE